MKPVHGQKKVLSSMRWRHPSLRGQCTVLRTKIIEVKAVGDPPQLFFFLRRKPRRPLLITVLTHDPAGLLGQSSFVPLAAMNPRSGLAMVWKGGRKAAKEAVENHELPSSLIDDIYPENGQPYITALKKKYPRWPLVGKIKLHVALQQTRERKNLVLLCGSKKRPVVVATAGKPRDPDIYTAPPVLAWTTGYSKNRGILNLNVGQRGLPRNPQEAKKLFQLLDIDTNLLDMILA